MQSFSRMLVTIEQQAADVNEYARRLDTAYKELESTSAQLKEFSFKDEVTGLYNRRFFSIRLEEEVSRYRRFNHPVSVVLLDLDGFKAINDDSGHAAGDETLRAMADILLKQSRGINVICRYGGDEFAVLLVETSKSGRPAVRRPHPLRALDLDLRPRPPGDRELRHRLPARGRGPRRRRAHPGRRRGALRGQARGQEPRVRPRGHRRRPGVRPGRDGDWHDRGASRSRRRRVLIVDDELDIRATLRAAFGSAGYECRIAGNGQEAAVLFDRERAPLTITDLKMPVMDGLELLRHVRARDADAAVIMLTGAGDVAVAVESLKQGAERLHPEAGRPRPDPALRRARARAPPAPDRAPRASRPPGVPGGGGHRRPGRRARGAAADLPGDPRGSGLGPRHPRGGHRAPLPPRARLLDRARPGAPPAGGRAGGARPRRAPARHRQDRHPRLDPPQAGPAHPRRMAGHADAPGDRPAAPRADPVPARRDPGGVPPPRALGRHRLPAGALRARRSRSAPASSRWRTRSTR